MPAALHASPRVIDLRPRAAFEAGHLPGSSRLDFEEIDVAYLRPPRWRPLIVVAEDAIRADDGARMLRGHGHQARGLSVGIGRYPGPWERGPERRPVWEPSPLVERWIDDIPPGAACDLACGSGRDAVTMAMRGHEVTAIDILPDALEQGARLAERHEVRIRFRLRRRRSALGWLGGAVGRDQRSAVPEPRDARADAGADRRRRPLALRDVSRATGPRRQEAPESRVSTEER